MATLDPARDALVVRIVYDGPPEAGKTTSLRALAHSLARPLHSPGSPGARTLYFDWLDYTAGRFDGIPIRCQLVSVPGQPELAARRLHLLGGADALVFVADSSAAALAASLDGLARLVSDVRAGEPPRPGIIVQANKRDLPGALPLDELRARLATVAPDLAVLESVASAGEGLRSTFVFAVRLALDRVRELQRLGALPVGAPAVDSSEALFDELAGVATGPAPATPDATAPKAHARDATPAPTRPPSRPGVKTPGPRPPDPTIPSGHIWPPIEGRILLHEAQLDGAPLHAVDGDGWAGLVRDRWRLHTPGAGRFEELERGRGVLIEWARLHSQSLAALSPARCIALADGGDGSWRLWQVVRVEESLRETLAQALETPDVGALAARLVQAGEWFAQALERLPQATCRLPVSLDTLGAAPEGPVYIGLMPVPAATRPAGPLSLDARRGLLRSEFADAVRAQLDARAHVVAEQLALEREPGSGTRRHVVEVLLDALAPRGRAAPPAGAP